MSGTVLAMVVLLAPVAGQAEEPKAIDAAYLVQVQPGPKRYFWTDGDYVPARPVRPGKAYVVPGNALLAFREQGGFTFAEYIAEDGRATIGWIQSAGLKRVAVPAPRAADWIGSWMGWDGSIEITRAKPGLLHFRGDATWGSHDPARVANGGINLGEFEADAMPTSDRIAFVDNTLAPWPASYELDYTSCRIKLRVLGPYLLAEDNMGCGGVNVTFTGEYRR